MRSAIVLLILLRSVAALANPDSLLAQRVLEQAMHFLDKGMPDSAAQIHRQAAKDFPPPGKQYHWHRLGLQIGRKCTAAGEYAAGVRHFRTALDHDAGPARDSLGHTVMASLYANLGYALGKLDEQEEKVEAYKKAAAIYEQHLRSENGQMYLAEFVYTQIGSAYNRMRDYKNAEHYYRRRSNIHLNQQNREYLAGAYSDLGYNLFCQEDYRQAMDCYTAGLGYLREAPLSSKILLLVNTGNACFFLNQPEMGLDITRQCHQLILDDGGMASDYADDLSWVYENYARYYRLKNDFPSALQYCNQRIEVFRDAGAAHRRELALASLSRAKLYLEWKKPEAALDDLDRALGYFLPGRHADGKHQLPRVEDLKTEPHLIDAIGDMAHAFMLLYQTHPDPELEARIGDCYARALETERLLQRYYILEGSKLNALREHRWFKGQHLAFLHRLHEKKPDPAIAEAIFAVSENSRAYLLWESLENTRAVESTDQQALRTQYDSLSNEIQELEQEMYEQSGGKAVFDERSSQLLQLKETQSRVLKTATAGNQAAREPIGLADFRRQLPPDCDALICFIQDGQSFLLVLPAGQGQLQVKRQDWTEALSAMAGTIASDISLENNRAYIEKARTLYEHLLRPVLPQLKAPRLLIIPDAELWSVPFAALLSEDIPKGRENNFRDFPYLIKSRALYYGFSATLQHEMSLGGSPNGRQGMLAIAPAYREIERRQQRPVAMADTRNALNPLLHNREEVGAIKAIAGGQTILDDKASKAAFLEAISSTRYLHIAAHAKANHAQPGFSFIAFSNIVDTAKGDFSLYAQELDHRYLPLDLVVLSACETGTGAILEGEGVFSLSRAFAAAGARSIVTTLWSIDDRASRDIMVDFYKKLDRGLSKDAALQQATLSYIETAPDQGRAHPRYWAAFTAIGNMEPVELGGWPWTGVLPAGLLILSALLGVVYLLKWRKPGTP